MKYPRKTKIICTIGPASNSYEVLKNMIEKGMDIARLNFSHGKHEQHLEVVEKIRQISKEIGREIAILQDLQGPKIRIENVENGAVEIVEGQEFTITTSNLEIGNNQIAQTSYTNLPNDLKKNDLLLIDDGYLILKVKEIKNNDVICNVIKGGTLKDRKGIIAPMVNFSAPSLSDKDIEDLKFGLSIGIDLVALSFVSSSRDIVELKTTMKIFGRTVPIIAKIERPEAIRNIDEIIKETDSIMIARGDLGLEYPVEDVPLLQKEIIAKCNFNGVPVITATQMLESMINNPRPTRAEASDVANAVFDGSDVLMLSGETSVGKYPLDALENMIKIIQKAEDKVYNNTVPDKLHNNLDETINDALAHATTAIAEQTKASAIVVVCSSMSSARNIAKFRPSTPIIGISNDLDLLRRMNLIWGIIPLFSEKVESFENIKSYVSNYMESNDLLKLNEHIVFLLGIKNTMYENMIKIYQFN